jgi:hypothetical protein
MSRSIREQVRANAVALISLVVAVSSLGYNTWRNETTEQQRNLRHAAFRVLEDLGELQRAADYRRYFLSRSEVPAAAAESRLRGYGSVAMIRDLTSLMPAPAPTAGRALHAAWSENVDRLVARGADGRATEDAVRAGRVVADAIDDTRRAVLSVLRSLE